MLPLGLRRVQERRFEAALADSHAIRTQVQVLDLDEDIVAAIDQDMIEDGQVNVDADGEITRSLTLSFVDRSRSYDFGTESPQDGSVSYRRLLRVRYHVLVPALEDWVAVPVFTGPAVKADRTGDTVNVEAQGKEWFGLGQAWRPMTIRKGTKKTTAIRRIMVERCGEHRRNLVIPDLPGRLPRAVSLGRETSPWLVVQKIAASMDRRAFYDGRGHFRLERHPGNPVFVFRDGTGGTVVTPPQLAYSTEGMSNAVWVVGGKPKAKKKDADADGGKKEKERGVRHFQPAAHRHPLSPYAEHGLGRQAPHFRVHRIDNDKIRSEREARQVARRALSKKLREQVDVTLDALPVPHLEGGDLVRINAAGLGMRVRLRQFSLPLKHADLMTVGFMDKVSQRTRRRNRK